MKTAARCALFAALLVGPLVAAGTTAKPEDVGLSSERLQRITQMIERRIAAGDLTGAVTVVARRGKVAHVAAQGVMDLETKQPMTPDTMFRIASMTKPIIGVSIMMLVEENKLRLNDPVARHIPEFANMKVAVARPATGGSEGPGFYTVPAQRPITIKDLLTHVSGLGSGPMGNSDIEKVARKDGETLAQYPPPGRHRAGVPARFALDLQSRRRLRDPRPHHRDRVGRAARPLRPGAHLRPARHA